MLVAISEVAHPGEVEAARRLLRQYAGSLLFGLEYQNFEAELAGLPEPYVPSSGCLFVASQALVPGGTVGMKRLADGIAEVKRLYVVPGARGGGIGKLLLAHVIEQASLIGYRSSRSNWRS